MDDKIYVSIPVKRALNQITDVKVMYKEFEIASDRKAIRFCDTKDETLKKNLFEKGFTFEDTEILIPINRPRKEVNWMPPYIPLRLCLVGPDNSCCLPIAEDNYLYLQFVGNLNSCLRLGGFPENERFNSTYKGYKALMEEKAAQAKLSIETVEENKK